MAVLVSLYLFALLCCICRALRVLVNGDTSAQDLCVLGLLVAFVIAALVGSFEGGYDTVHTGALAFASFVSVPTFCVWALCLLVMPRDLAGARPTVLGAAELAAKESEGDVNHML